MKQLRPTENKPILLLQYVSQSNFVTFQFRVEQTLNDIKAGKPPENCFYLFDPPESTSIRTSGIGNLRLPRWIIIKSFSPFVWMPYGASMDEFLGST
jgi:hypothetical protein